MPPTGVFSELSWDFPFITEFIQKILFIAHPKRYILRVRNLDSIVESSSLTDRVHASMMSTNHEGPSSLRCTRFDP